MCVNLQEGTIYAHIDRERETDRAHPIDNYAICSGVGIGSPFPRAPPPARWRQHFHRSEERNKKRRSLLKSEPTARNGALNCLQNRTKDEREVHITQGAALTGSSAALPHRENRSQREETTTTAIAIYIHILGPTHKILRINNTHTPLTIRCNQVGPQYQPPSP